MLCNVKEDVCCGVYGAWRERNDRSFKDRKRTFEEIKALFFLYFISLDKCFCFSCGIFFFFLLARCFILYTLCVLGYTLHI